MKNLIEKIDYQKVDAEERRLLLLLQQMNGVMEKLKRVEKLKGLLTEYYDTKGKNVRGLTNPSIATAMVFYENAPELALTLSISEAQHWTARYKTEQDILHYSELEAKDKALAITRNKIFLQEFMKKEELVRELKKGEGKKKLAQLAIEAGVEVPTSLLQDEISIGGSVA